MVEVDFVRYQVYPGTEDYDWYLARYSAIIVHEATHAELHYRNFPYTKRTRAQIERICLNEQRRFLDRWSCREYDIDNMAPEFDEKKWHSHWNRSLVQTYREGMKRLENAEGEYERGRPPTIIDGSESLSRN